MELAIAPKGRPYFRPNARWMAAGAAGLVLCLWALLLGCSRRHASAGGMHSMGVKRLSAERARLLEQVAQFNKAAQGSGFEIVAGLRAASPAPLQQAGPGHAARPAEGCGACDPPDPDQEFRVAPKEQVEAENPVLAAKLQQYALGGEIMLALANGVMICQNTTICWWQGGNILESFLAVMQRAGVRNHIIAVLDDETERYLAAKPGAQWFRVTQALPKAQDHSHPANKVSSMKYLLLQIFISLGYNTLITDMDLVYVQNPFQHLHRDADIEVQTDGFDDRAYGRMGSVADASMGWGGGGLYLTTFTTNVGCMWVKANARSYKLMKQVMSSLLSAPGWDQQVFNQYLMLPSHGGHQSAHAHLRVMDYKLWVNSKIFFKTLRQQYLPGAASTAPLPIMVHMNYHPDKHKRMLCIMDRYYSNKVDACDAFPGGSQPGT